MVDFDLENYSFIDLNNFQLSEPPSFFIPDTDSTYTESDLLNEEKDLGVCKVCGRKLRGFDSCHLGMGPICFKRYKETLAHTKKLF